MALAFCESAPLFDTFIIPPSGALLAKSLALQFSTLCLQLVWSLLFPQRDYTVHLIERVPPIVCPHRCAASIEKMTDTCRWIMYIVLIKL